VALLEFYLLSKLPRLLAAVNVIGNIGNWCGVVYFWNFLFFRRLSGVSVCSKHVPRSRDFVLCYLWVFFMQMFWCIRRHIYYPPLSFLLFSLCLFFFSPQECFDLLSAQWGMSNSIESFSYWGEEANTLDGCCCFHYSQCFERVHVGCLILAELGLVYCNVPESRMLCLCYR
jgi:hypothetical protein